MADDFPPTGTPTDANGTVQLTGTFTSITFTATFGGNDEIVMQIGAEVIPAPSCFVAFVLCGALVPSRARRRNS